MGFRIARFPLERHLKHQAINQPLTPFKCGGVWCLEKKPSGTKSQAFVSHNFLDKNILFFDLSQKAEKYKRMNYAGFSDCYMFNVIAFGVIGTYRNEID